ncbi:MAG: hypothetical protein ACLVJ6_12435 [Merdibacter sp.]
MILIVCLPSLSGSWQRGFRRSWSICSPAGHAGMVMSDVMADLMPLIQVDVSDVICSTGFSLADQRGCDPVDHPPVYLVASICRAQPCRGRRFNHLLGAVLGAVKAFIVTYVLLMILYLP